MNLKKSVLINASFVFLLLLTNSQGRAYAQTPLQLPNQTDWTNRGVAIREGNDGQWDRYLWGGFSNNLIKKGNTYYLYYQGSPYYDNTCDSVAYRAIGVATSTDGVNWVKHNSSPVIEWSQSGSVEEGASGSGAWLGSDGKVYIYYGANSGTDCNVSTAGRLAVSSDGINFSDMGQVISPTNSNIWGYGDEIHPVGVYEYNGKWNVFYIPNGVSFYRKLGVVSGNSSTSLTSSSGVNSGNLSAWGTVSTVLNGSSSYAFVNDPGTGLPIKVYRFNPTSPANMTLEKTYSFSDCNRGSVIYDGAQSRWLMLCRESANASYYLIKTAPSSSQITPTPTPTNTVTPSPTKTPTPSPTKTPTPTLTPVPLPGDINLDGIVNLQDYVLLSNAFGTNNSAADINRDGIVNLQDYVILSNNFGRTG